MTLLDSIRFPIYSSKQARNTYELLPDDIIREYNHWWAEQDLMILTEDGCLAHLRKLIREYDDDIPCNPVSDC